MEVPEEKENTQKKKVQGYFSQEFYLDRQKTAEFLRGLADELEKEGEIRISTEEWELPFNSGEQAEIEIELEDDELEIEIELEKSKGGDNLKIG